MISGTVTIVGNPVSVNAAYRGGRGSFYMADEASAWKEAVWYAAKSDWRRPHIAGRVSVTLDLFFTKRNRRDIDNVAKLILDGLAGVCYVDDSQVDELHIFRRHDPKRPRVVATVSEIKPSL